MARRGMASGQMAVVRGGPPRGGCEGGGIVQLRPNPLARDWVGQWVGVHGADSEQAAVAEMIRIPGTGEAAGSEVVPRAVAG